MVSWRVLKAKCSLVCIVKRNKAIDCDVTENVAEDVIQGCLMLFPNCEDLSVVFIFKLSIPSPRPEVYQKAKQKPRHISVQGFAVDKHHDAQGQSYLAYRAKFLPRLLHRPFGLAGWVLPGWWHGGGPNSVWRS